MARPGAPPAGVIAELPQRRKAECRAANTGATDGGSRPWTHVGQVAAHGGRGACRASCIAEYCPHARRVLGRADHNQKAVAVRNTAGAAYQDWMRAQLAYDKANLEFAESIGGPMPEPALLAL